jgi:HD-like signal output (HDOD) protein
MELDCDLFGSNGRFLMPEGAVIEGKHLRVFKIWGVTEIEVRDDGDDASAGARENLDPEVLARSEEKVAELFALTDHEHPAISELKKPAVMRGVSMLMNNEELPQVPKPSADLGAEKLYPPSVKQIVDRQTRLSTYPDIYMRIVEVLENPRSSASHIADVVGKDTGISVKLLKLVNSPFYGFPTRIDSLDRAVALIGANELTTLALGISVVNHFEGVPDSVVNMKAFWLHSVACGVLARLFANRKVGLNEERFFVAGLLHDMAKLVMYKETPEYMAAALQTAHDKSICQYQAEKRILGYNHTRLGEALLGAWKLPSPLQRMIRFHHSPQGAAGGLDSAIIHVSDVMAIALMYGSSGQYLVPPLKAEAWESLELGTGAITAAARQSGRQIREIMKIFQR